MLELEVATRTRHQPRCMAHMASWRCWPSALGKCRSEAHEMLPCCLSIPAGSSNRDRCWEELGKETFGTRTGPLAQAPSLAGSLRKGTTIVYGWDGKGCKRHFLQQVPLPWQWKHSSRAANSPLVSPGRSWHHRLHSAWGRGQTFDVPALALPARASLHTSLCCFFPLLSATHFSFLFHCPAPPKCGENGEMPILSHTTRLVRPDPSGSSSPSPVKQSSCLEVGSP